MIKSFKDELVRNSFKWITLMPKLNSPLSCLSVKTGVNASGKRKKNNTLKHKCKALKLDPVIFNSSL